MSYSYPSYHQVVGVPDQCVACVGGALCFLLSPNRSLAGIATRIAYSPMLKLTALVRQHGARAC